MAGKLFISMLGASGYRPCKYYLQNTNELSSSTRFAQKATLELLGAKEWTANDRIRIFVTSLARKNNWESRTDDDGKVIMGQKDELADLGLDVKAVDIPDGSNEDELMQIFIKVYESIDDGDEVYFDVTHGFRYLPMLVLVLINYAKVLKHIKVGSISYGSFETPGTDKPLVDLKPLSDLQEWTAAAADFLHNGHSEQLERLSMTKIRNLIKEAFINNKPSDEQKNIRNFVKALSEFTDERHSCRGDLIESGESLKKIENFGHNFSSTGQAPLTPLLQYVKDNVKTRDSEIERILDAAAWCCDMKLYQQAVTLVQEGVVTYFVRRHGLGKYILDEGKRGLVNSAFEIHSKKIPEEKWIVKEEDKQLLTEIVNDEQVKELKGPFSQLKKWRNTFNHAGFQKDSSATNEDKIRKSINTFSEVICKGKVLPSTDTHKEAVFLNLSNHPSASWSKEQLDAAKIYGRVEDMNFPQISPTASADDISLMVSGTEEKILSSYADKKLTVHVMGEMSFTCKLVSRLRAYGIRCVVSTTTRDVKELGNGKRETIFHFVRFRDY